MTKHTSASATFTRDWLDSQAAMIEAHSPATRLLKPLRTDDTLSALDSTRAALRARPIKGERLALSASYLLIASIVLMGVATVAIWTHILLDSTR